MTQKVEHIIVNRNSYVVPIFMFFVMCLVSFLFSCLWKINLTPNTLFNNLVFLVIILISMYIYFNEKMYKPMIVQEVEHKIVEVNEQMSRRKERR